MSRVSSARERWQQIVARQQSSGLGVAEFCRRHGVAVSSLFAWRRQLGCQAGADAKPAFVAVEPAAAEPTGGGGETDATGIDLHLGARVGERWLVVRRGFDAQTLRQLLAVLEGQS